MCLAFLKGFLRTEWSALSPCADPSPLMSRRNSAHCRSSRAEASPGQALTVVSNVIASQIECLWYRDGVPIVGETGTSYELSSRDIGHKIRCHVRAVSVLDQPEAWTPESETVG